MKAKYVIQHRFTRKSFQNISGANNRCRKGTYSRIVNFLVKSLQEDGIDHFVEVEEDRTIITAEGMSNKTLDRFKRVGESETK